MRSYTIHIFNRLGVPARLALDFENDEDAVRTMYERGLGHAVEIWQADRLVKRFEAGETLGAWPPDGFR